VGEHGPAGPASDSPKAAVAVSIQTVTTFEDTDASFRSGAPSLPVAEPTPVLPLSLCFRGTPGRRDADLLYSCRFRLRCVLPRPATPKLRAAYRWLTWPASTCGRSTVHVPLRWRRGRPTCLPCRLARAMPARTRSAIRLRSNCAKLAIRLRSRSLRGEAPLVSTMGFEYDRSPTPHRRRSATVFAMCATDRKARSRFQTGPGRAGRARRCGPGDPSPRHGPRTRR